MLTCNCSHRRTGFTEVNGWWVCGNCWLPAPLYAEKMINGHSVPNLTTNENGEARMAGLVYFQGGPLDGHAYEAETLLSSADGLPVPITEYMWTSEKKTSESTGKVAHIWRHVSLNGSAPAAEAAASTSVTPDAPAPPTEPAVPASMTGAAAPNDPTANVDPAPVPAPAQEEVSPTPDATPAAQDGSPIGDVLARRKALKISRAIVSEKSGLAQSKIAAIENGTGTRIKDEERRALADALTALEAEKNGAQPVGSGASAHA